MVAVFARDHLFFGTKSIKIVLTKYCTISKTSKHWKMMKMKLKQLKELKLLFEFWHKNFNPPPPHPMAPQVVQVVAQRQALPRAATLPAPNGDGNCEVLRWGGSFSEKWWFFHRRLLQLFFQFLQGFRPFFCLQLWIRWDKTMRLENGQENGQLFQGRLMSTLTRPSGHLFADSLGAARLRNGLAQCKNLQTRTGCLEITTRINCFSGLNTKSACQHAFLGLKLEVSWIIVWPCWIRMDTAGERTNTTGLALKRGVSRSWLPGKTLHAQTVHSWSSSF